MNLRGEPTDGVVSVSSARQWDVESEYLVSLRHKEIHQHWTTSRHIMHILRIHAQESWHVKLEVLE